MCRAFIRRGPGIPTNQHPSNDRRGPVIIIIGTTLSIHTGLTSTPSDGRQGKEGGGVASEREGHERGTGSGHENVGFWKKQGRSMIILCSYVMSSKAKSVLDWTRRIWEWARARDRVRSAGVQDRIG